MRYFPVFLDLRGKECLVAGAGEVGRRKIDRLRACGASRVLVVDPSPPADLGGDEEPDAVLAVAARQFEERDLQGKFLVIASTGDQTVNARISELCRERGILCNIVDQPEYCSFIVPAVVQRGDLGIAVSTSGASPALAARIKKRLDREFGEEYGLWLALLRRLRPVILELGLGARANRELFRSLTEEALLEAIAQGDSQRLLGLLRSRLPQELHPRLKDVVDGLFESP
jgi:precorrin-2 dehydrogenase/sirohydrochlorin ferrochelatase